MNLTWSTAEMKLDNRWNGWKSSSIQIGPQERWEPGENEFLPAKIKEKPKGAVNHRFPVRPPSFSWCGTSGRRQHRALQRAKMEWKVKINGRHRHLGVPRRLLGTRLCKRENWLHKKKEKKRREPDDDFLDSAQAIGPFEVAPFRTVPSKKS